MKENENKTKTIVLEFDPMFHRLLINTFKRVLNDCFGISGLNVKDKHSQTKGE